MINNQINSIKSFVLFFVSVIFFSCTALAQPFEGMHFEQGLSWQQILDKAKNENKYIFVDCFTTWCPPCKFMETNIYPLKEAGSFYNDHFIIVKIQMDSTKNDNADVKSWVKTANEFRDNYNVMSYPTLLFFNPNGELVHRSGEALSIDKFIAIGKDALNKKNQYYSNKKLYENGARDTALLLRLVKGSKQLNDFPFVSKVSNDYLNTQTDLLTATNIMVLNGNINKSTDRGFKEMINNPTLFDTYNYPGYAMDLLRDIIIREDILPVIVSDGHNADKNPDWDGLMAIETKKYPFYGSVAVDYFKIQVAEKMSDWPLFTTLVNAYIKKYKPNVPKSSFSYFAYKILNKCDDRACIKEALNWSKESITSKTKDARNMFLYGNLLYKFGNTKDAIMWQTNVKAIAPKENVDMIENVIQKMKKGEKTW